MVHNTRMYSLPILVGILCWLSVAAASVPSSENSPPTALISRDAPCANGPTKDLNGKSYNIKCNADTSVGASSHQYFGSGSWQQCMTVCDTTTGCSGWTWVPAGTDGGTCWFKNGKIWFYDSTTGYVAGVLDGGSSDDTGNGQTTNSASSNTTCTDTLASAPEGRSRGRWYQIHCRSDTSIPASASKTFNSGTYFQCPGVCDVVSGCTGWTWVPQGLGGTCWFKKSKDIVFYDASAGYVGGILTNRPPTPTESPKSTLTTEQPMTGTTTTTQPKPVDTKAPAKSNPLTCGINWRKAGYPFWACHGRLAIWDFCQVQFDAGESLVPERYYELPDVDGGMLITHERYPPGNSRCDPSSKPPPPRDCASKCNPQCYSNLATILNNCQTNTVTKKMVRLSEERR